MKSVLSIFLTLCLFFATSVNAETPRSQCDTVEQNNGLVVDADGLVDVNASDLTKQWKCPSLQNVQLNDGEYPFIHKLQDVDFSNGTYRCGYFYKNSGEYKQTCAFASKLYQGLKEKVRANLYGYKKADGTLTNGAMTDDDDLHLGDVLEPYIRASQLPVPFVNAFRAFNNTRRDLLNIESNNGNTNYSDTNDEARLIRLYTTQMKQLVHQQLVQVWEDGYSTVGARRGHTLSNFVAGVITLDPNIIKGYNPNNGKLMIKQEWIDSASVIDGFTDRVGASDDNGIVDFILSPSKWFSSDDDENTEKPTNIIEKTLYNGGVEYKIYSYAQLFQNKLWGFYYVLQERFDIGYNFLSTALLFLMSGWLFFTVGIGEATRYFSDQDKYKMEMREGAYMKTMIVAGTLAMFFLSLPSGLNDAVSEDNSFTQNQMQKNYTLAKKFIRETAQIGSNIATMFNDLGLSAYVEFIAKKEMAMNITEIRRSLEMSMDDMYMYSSALEIRNECAKNYIAKSDADFINSMSSTTFLENESWKDTQYATNKNISAISFQACQKAYRIYINAPYQVALAVGEAQQEMIDTAPKMAEATYLMIYNNLALNEKLGWVGGFSTVLNYLILKNNSMFLDKGIDNEKVQETAKGITNSTSFDGKNVSLATFGGKVQDKIAYGVSYAMDIMNGLYMHNILPMFSDIQKSISGYMERIYESKLKIALERKKDDGEDMLDSMRSEATSFLTKANGFAYIVKFIGYLMPDTFSYTMWHTAISIISYVIAIKVWKMTFSVIFTILVSLLFVISFVMYFFDLVVHFVTSLFMFVWAFTKHQSGQGDGKIKEWFKNTIVIIALKPTVLIFGVYIFIFSYELLTELYVYVFSSVTTSLLATVSLMSVANKNTNLFDSISGYTTIMSMQTVAEITIDLFALYIAYVSIIKLPSMVYKKLGVESEDSTSHHQVTESVTQKAESHNNPIK